MKSAKEFAGWLYGQFKDRKQGVYLTKEDVATLSGRQRFTHEFITDIHYELALKGMGFVTDTHREKFYLFHLPSEHWQHQDGTSRIHTLPPAKHKTP